MAFPEHDASPARRRIWPLLAGWAAWWTALPLVTLGEPVALFRRLKQENPAGTSALSIDVDGPITLTVTSHGAPMWSAATTALELVLWVAGPPIIMLVLWMWWRGDRGPGASDVAGAERLLHEGVAKPVDRGVHAAPRREA